MIDPDGAHVGIGFLLHVGHDLVVDWNSNTNGLGIAARFGRNLQLPDLPPALGREGSTFALKGAHRKPLMLQRFPYPRVNMLKSATADPGDAFNTSGTTPGTSRGSVFDSGRTRLLTGKSDTTSELLAHHPRTKSAHAAVRTENRRTPDTLDNPLIRPTTDGSN